MWSAQTTTNAGMSPFASAGAQPQQQQQKHDIFVGNLAFTTTEEQLLQIFSEIGRIIKVRMVSDLETGKPRGFAFVEFEDPQAALAAIRNMNEYELNGRKLRVNFSNSSHLETLAGKLNMDMNKKDTSIGSTSGIPSAYIGATIESNNTKDRMGADVGTQAVSNALKNMSKGEMYDVIAKLKQIADTDPDEARKIVSGHPQLPEAILFLMSQLDMIKTPLANTLGGGVVGPPPPMVSAVPLPPPNLAVPPPVRVDPRDPRAKLQPPPAVQSVPAVAAPTPIDPRAGAVDPRARMQQQTHQAPTPIANAPPPPMPQYGNPMPIPRLQQIQQPQQPVPVPQMGVAGLDPGLVQQVMGLTPAQIGQLPVDKQSSILSLRQQITNAMAAGAK